MFDCKRPLSKLLLFFSILLAPLNIGLTSAQAGTVCDLLVQEFGAKLNPYIADGTVNLPNKIVSLEDQLAQAKAAKDDQKIGETVRDLAWAYQADSRILEAAWTLKRVPAGEASAQQIISGLRSTLEAAQKVSSKPLGGGISETILVTLPGNINGVFKPDGTGGWTAWASNYRHEIAAYKVDKLFGLDITPVTVEVTLEGRVGSFQYFVKNANLGGSKDWRIKLLDYLIAGGDRHGGNYLTRPGGYIVAIDHGISFGIGSGGDLTLTERLIPTKKVWEIAKSITQTQLDSEIQPLLTASYDAIMASAPDKKDNQAVTPISKSGDPKFQYNKFLERFENWKLYVASQIEASGESILATE